MKHCAKQNLLSDEVVLKIENVNLTGNLGTCNLVSSSGNFTMAYEIIVYPPAIPMPGAPYPVKFRYTIYNVDNSKVNSVTGEFIFQENSGTLPNNCALGIPYGDYKSLARDNKLHEAVYLKFKLSLTDLEIYVF